MKYVLTAKLRFFYKYVMQNQANRALNNDIFDCCKKIPLKGSFNITVVNKM